MVKRHLQLLLCLLLALALLLSACREVVAPPATPTAQQQAPSQAAAEARPAAEPAASSGEPTATATPPRVAAPPTAAAKPASPTPALAPSVAAITIAAVGDVMCHDTQIRGAFVGGQRGYDFTPVFAPIRAYVARADIAIANLETPLAGKAAGYSGYPKFNCPEPLATALKGAGFDIITTANNHSLDRGSRGLKQTLDYLDQAGLLHTGTARTADERQRTLLSTVKGIKIAFLAYTYGTNGLPIPKDEPYVVNLINRGEMARDVRQAREAGADLVVVSAHFGTEYERQPNKAQRELVDFLFAEGVDVVLGSHPHVLQPLYVKDAADGSRQVAIYSLGNFVSDQRDRYRDGGIVLNIAAEKDFQTGITTLKAVDYTPTWVDRSVVNGVPNFRVLAIREAIQAYEGRKDPLLVADDYERLRRTWNDTTGHLATGRSGGSNTG